MKLFLVVGFLVVVGCASTLTQKMNSQIGVMTVEDAMAKWGAPISKRKTDDGGTMMVWASRSYAASQPQYVAPRGPTYGGTAGDSAQERGVNLAVLFDQRGLMQQWNYERR